MSMIDSSTDEPLFADGGETETQEELEARAWAMGWRPEEQYRGAPGTWKTAEEFIEHGNSQLPILRKQTRDLSGRLARQDGELAGLRRTVAEQKEALDSAMKLAKRADERGYQRALAEMDQRLSEAAEQGDVAAVRQITAERDTLVTERTKDETPPTPATSAAPAPNPEVAAFIEANPWFKEDKQLQRTMIASHEIIAARDPDMPMAQQLKEAKKRVMAEFPDRFPPATPIVAGNEEDDEPPAPRRPSLATVARPGGPAAPRRQASGFDQIADPAERAEAKAEFAKLKRVQPDADEAEWLAIYLDPHADVLAIQRARKK